MKCISAIILPAVMFLLGSCGVDEAKLRFCERENRVIPDAELKGRLLWDIRRDGSSYGKLPDYLEAYLVERLPANATDKQAESILAEYAAKNPLCCQFVKRSDNIANLYEGKIPYQNKKTDYFADFEMIKNESDFQDLNKPHKYGITSRGVSAAFSCGEAFVYDYG